MIDGKRTLVVVPARGGSKGVPLKNLHPVAGVPLVAITGQLVQSLDWVDCAVVSTDHATIAKTCKENGLGAPFYRPEDLSGDRIGDLDVLTHALKFMEGHDNCQYDVVVMLQPTSPLRRAEHVTETATKCVQGGFDAVWTVSESDSKAHPLKQLTFENDQLKLYDDAGGKIIARQQLSKVYYRNGGAYAITRDCLLNKKSIMGDNTSAVVIDEPMVSIDTLEDFAKVEEAFEARKKEVNLEISPLPTPNTEGSKKFVVDIDGVLATLQPDNNYNNAGPMKQNIEIINGLYDQGHKIILFTARGYETGIDWREVTENQMNTWGVKYHELKLGKPAGDFYIDDRLIGIDTAGALFARPAKKGDVTS